MRSQPTSVERKCTQALADAFKKDGHTVFLPDRESYDKPDILIEIAGFRIACECTQIPPSYIYQFTHKKEKSAKPIDKGIISYVWPNEPHEWVADAIGKKVNLVPEYLERTHAKEAWLLIHSPEHDSDFLVDGDKEWIQWALRHGAKMIEHPFSQIYLWTPSGGIQAVSFKKNEEGLYSELGIDFSEGYPTLCVNRVSLNFKTTKGHRDPPHKSIHMHNLPLTTIVPPKDSTYSKYNPALRNVLYSWKVTAWHDQAIVEMQAELTHPCEISDLKPMEVKNLKPDTDYYAHYLHQFKAPKTFKTYHVVQPRG